MRCEVAPADADQMAAIAVWKIFADGSEMPGWHRGHDNSREKISQDTRCQEAEQRQPNGRQQPRPRISEYSEEGEREVVTVDLVMRLAPGRVVRSRDHGIGEPDETPTKWPR